MNAMRLRAKYTSENGDYYQAAFKNTDSASDVADVDGSYSPFLLIWCEFEDPDGGQCCVETREYRNTSGISLAFD